MEKINVNKMFTKLILDFPCGACHTRTDGPIPKEVGKHKEKSHLRRDGFF
jgi:hypothetical protein